MARALAVAVVVQTVGFGLLTTLSAIYFVTIQEMGVAEVGIGMTIAALCGLLAGVAVGHLSDRTGARGLLSWLLVAAAVCVLAHLLVNSLQMNARCLPATPSHGHSNHGTGVRGPPRERHLTPPTESPHSPTAEPSPQP
ncbi:hypothetical protein [Rathayibacter toxicus]|uniref:Major facilitator superfamily (MFS) profile domain-containing protein n=1 Tax=Rathayibacter toxicus TaxID=145458 RepID=A0A0C5BHS3_9MICO|nr:hypothetical protein [Rathayibacter toxicus]AJM77825.1 hypothetical protein TI83_07435 [Rathayibacter toxicus]KKM44298.1 hypothetical protein VT73_10380 [Rathayibacter toxicus]PPG20323.1 hypothetical protein C5D15_07260 [Rathayibacter toxicus]PPG45424.1 hypothetical protein C5D16_07225 [Rathayibacter toxicus]PPH22526.1 hypothetical protein C5D17_07270 [Rathayibacter toxicus]